MPKRESESESERVLSRDHEYPSSGYYFCTLCRRASNNGFHFTPQVAKEAARFLHLAISSIILINPPPPFSLRFSLNIAGNFICLSSCTCRKGDSKTPTWIIVYINVCVCICANHRNTIFYTRVHAKLPQNAI